MKTTSIGILLCCSCCSGPKQPPATPQAVLAPRPAVADATTGQPAPATPAPVEKSATPAPWVIPAGHEQAILDLFQPIQDGGDVVRGWPMSSVKVEGEKIEVRVGRDQAAVLVTLVHVDAPGESVATTKSFKVRKAAQGDGAPVDAIVTRLVEALRANDQGGLWVRADQAPRGAP